MSATLADWTVFIAAWVIVIGACMFLEESV